MGKHTRGRIELICGSMFSGKTEELIRRLRRAKIARQQVQVFKPAIDDRYHVERVMSHNGLDFEARPVAAAADIVAAVEPATTVVAIDEVQFFDPEIIANHGHPAPGVRSQIHGHQSSTRRDP